MPAASPPGGSTGNQAGSQTSDLKSLLVQGLYAILFLIILIAALQLYFSVQQFISTWFSDEFIPVFNTLYYLAVVVGGIYLIFAYIRRR
jgi:multisubunit Na+/H+ antiporter MnhB subunit